MPQKTYGQDQIIQRLRKNLLNLFFPPYCICCEKIGKLVCKDCEKEIFKNNKYISAHKDFPELSKLIYLGNFSNPYLKEAIHKYKYEGTFTLASIFGEYLVDKIKKEKISFDLIAFVPATRKRNHWRGYNQSELLAKELSKKLKKPIYSDLIKLKDTKTQVGLDKKDRKKNLKSVFKCSGKTIRDKTILLIDDVTTTGSTLSECAKALKKKGAREIIGTVIARE